MYVCGYDIYISVMLGVVLLLKVWEVEFLGWVWILFQLVEENFGGVKILICVGVLEEVLVIFGMYNEFGLLVGEFVICGGVFYVNVDCFVFKVIGKGVYVVCLYEGRDVILLVSQLVMVLQSVVSWEVNIFDLVVFSVMWIQGGNIWNVLLESVELEGMLCIYSSEVQQWVKVWVSEIVVGFVSVFGVQIDVFWYVGLMVLVNDVCWVDFVSEVVVQVGYCIYYVDLYFGGEDFVVYFQYIFGVFVSIGSVSEYGLYYLVFNLDEWLIVFVVYYFVCFVEEVL